MSTFRDGIQLGRLNLLHWDKKSHFNSKAPVFLSRCLWVLLTPLLSNAADINLKLPFPIKNMIMTI